MSADDIDQIADIERESFSAQWPQTAYRRELQNKMARYFVIAEQPSDARDDGRSAGSAGIWSTLRRIVGGEDAPIAGEQVLGFIGVWLMAGEAHVVTVAVRERCRRMGIAERLLITIIEMAMEYEQEVVTLEVRKSNDAAQELYLKYGFDRVGLRVKYYTDNNEDAVIMTTPDVSSDGFYALFERLRRTHHDANPDLWA